MNSDKFRAKERKHDENALYYERHHDEILEKRRIRYKETGN